MFCILNFTLFLIRSLCRVLNLFTFIVVISYFYRILIFLILVFIHVLLVSFLWMGLGSILTQSGPMTQIKFRAQVPFFAGPISRTKEAQRQVTRLGLAAQRLISRKAMKRMHGMTTYAGLLLACHSCAPIRAPNFYFPARPVTLLYS